MFIILMKQTRQAVHAIKQSIFLDAYGASVFHVFIEIKAYT